MSLINNFYTARYRNVTTLFSIHDRRTNFMDINLMLKKIYLYSIKTLMLLTLIMQPMMHSLAKPNQTSYRPPQYSSLVRLTSQLLQGGEKYSKLITDLTAAFYDPKSLEVVLYINCAGGEMGMSSEFYETVKKLKKDTGKPIYSFVKNQCTSGGYMAACATDAIISCDNYTFIGSIGTILSFTNIFYANKAQGKQVFQISSNINKKDPRVMDPESAEFNKLMIRSKQSVMQINDIFLNIVMAARGAKLKITREKLAEAEVYLPQEALKHGLLDGVMDENTFMSKYCRGSYAVCKMEDGSKKIFLLNRFKNPIKLSSAIKKDA
jgi:ClpP class serine protease